MHYDSRCKEMQVGDNVKCTVSGKAGKCLGPIFHFQVWWMQVELTDGSIVLVHKDYLEVISESR